MLIYLQVANINKINYLDQIGTKYCSKKINGLIFCVRLNDDG
jgi:hypothetical protein